MTDELIEHYPDELHEADAINWDALASEIGHHSGYYLLPPDGEKGEDRLDKLALCQDVARHYRDGGEVDLSKVLVG